MASRHLVHNKVNKSAIRSVQRQKPASQSKVEPSNLSLVVQQAKTASSAMSASDVLYLQRTIGNEAVNRLWGNGDRYIQRQPVPNNQSLIFRKESKFDKEAVASSDVMSPRKGGKLNTNAPDLTCDPAVNPNNAACYLTSERRQWLRAETGDRINAAFSNFLIACEHKSAQLKAELAKAQAMFDLLLKTAFGFGVGQLSSMILNGIDKMPASAPAWIQEAGLKVLDKPDLVKKGLEKLEGKVRDSIKERYPKDPVTFINKVQDEASMWAQIARGEIPGYNDEQLLTAYATWDAENTKISYYETALDDLIKKFKELSLLGKHDPGMPMGGMGGPSFPWTNRAVWVNVYPGQRALANMLVWEEKIDDPRNPRSNKEYFFRAWVPSQMEDIAIEKTKHRYGEIDSIGPNDYKNYLPGMAIDFNKKK